MGALITVGVNTLAFLIISKVVPGFEVRNNKTNFFIAVAYSILLTVAGILVLPLTFITAAILWVVALIPLIGPVLAGAGALVTMFILAFGITAILLMIIDKAMDDFAMRSPAVAFVAAFLMAILNVAIRYGLGV